MDVYENERGTFIFNSKDLCMIEYIPELINAGIDSFKVEGRMKTALYAATIAGAYRSAIDDYMESEEKYRENLPYYREEVRRCTHRKYGTGFFFGMPDESGQIYDESVYVNDYVYLGTIEQAFSDHGIITQKNKFHTGDVIEVMRPGQRSLSSKVLFIKDEDGNPMDSCPHASQKLLVGLDMELKAGDVLRIGK